MEQKSILLLNMCLAEFKQKYFDFASRNNNGIKKVDSSHSFDYGADPRGFPFARRSRIYC